MPFKICHCRLATEYMVFVNVMGHYEKSLNNVNSISIPFLCEFRKKKNTQRSAFWWLASKYSLLVIKKWKFKQYFFYTRCDKKDSKLFRN